MIVCIVNLLHIRDICIKYEDLVDRPEETVAALYYKHLKLGLTLGIQNVVYAHTHAENITGTIG